MVTLAIYVGTTALLLWGTVRKPQAIMVALSLSFIVGTLLASFYHHEQLRPMLMACDAFIVLAMAGLWVKHHSQRARIVGSIGFLQVALALVYANGTNWNYWAATENAAFILQIVVAGGFADGIANWLAARFGGFRVGSIGLRRNVGGG